MPTPVRSKGLALALLLASAPCLAWTPYGPAPYGPGSEPGLPGAAGAPAPGGYVHPSEQVRPSAPGGEAPSAVPGYGPRPGFGFPPGYGGPATPGFGPGPSPYSEGPAFPGNFPAAGWGPGRAFGPGLRIERRTTEDAYIVTVHTGNQRPDKVQVTTQGRWLVIGRDTSERQVREETFDQGRGYARSFSYSSGTGSRRLTLPRDADPTAMTREDGEDAIHLVIPRAGYR